MTRGQDHPVSETKIGDVDIRDSVGVAVGPGASADVRFINLSQQREEAIVLLDDFLKLLAAEREALTDQPALYESVASVRAELKEQTPKWPVVRTMLRGIAASVAGIASLTAAISNIQSLVSHMT